MSEEFVNRIFFLPKFIVAVTATVQLLNVLKNIISNHYFIVNYACHSIIMYIHTARILPICQV